MLPLGGPWILSEGGCEQDTGIGLEQESKTDLSTRQGGWFKCQSKSWNCMLLRPCTEIPETWEGHHVTQLGPGLLEREMKF
jgi:hypothetical protein